MNNRAPSRRIAFGILSIIFICIIPVIIWLTMKPLSERFGTFAMTVRSIGQLSGLVGMVLFSGTIILSARIKLIEDVFNGLNEVFIRHHQVGTAAFILLMAHPISLSLMYIENSLYASARLLLPDIHQLPTLFGILSLFLLTSHLILTFFARPAYQLWKKLHGWMLPIALAIATVHLVLITSDTTYSAPLKGYLFGLVLLALGALLYRKSPAIFPSRSHHYELTSVSELNNSVVEMIMETHGEKLNFIPGQFIFIEPQSPDLPKEQHPFSITSSPSEPHIRLIIKNLGDYTSRVKNLKPGDPVNVEGPYGNFSYLSVPNRRQCWIAGGIGITPFLSMAKHLCGHHTHFTIDLFYCTRSENDAVYLDELKHLETNCKFLRVHSICSLKTGRITAETIEQVAPSLNDRDILVCGPKPMVDDLTSQFIERGIPSARIHSEAFQL